MNTVTEGRREEDVTRLARVEEQVKGIREDLVDFKNYMTSTVGTFMTAITEMQKNYMPRNEIHDKFEIRDHEIHDLKKRVEQLEQDQKEMSKRPTWAAVAIITLIGAAFGSLTLGIIELLNHFATK